MERIIDLENSRYADREYDGPLPESAAGPDPARQRRRAAALARMRARAEFRDDMARDVLTLLGLDDD